jgi:hypothetical protein
MSDSDIAATPAPIWRPAVLLDLEHASTDAFEEAVEKFNEWAATLDPLAPLNITTGWHCMTPPQAEALLLRNPHNRKVTLGTVKLYAWCMREGQWRRTGQPLLINIEGEVIDAQHRLWACYLGLVSFDTFIVADVPIEPDLFAYIDAGKLRSNADALYTAGINHGNSTAIAQAAVLAHAYNHDSLGAYKLSKKGTGMIKIKQRKLRSYEVLTYAREHPELEQAAHHLAGNYPRAISVIAGTAAKGVPVLLAALILAEHGQDALASFMLPVGSGADLKANDPILHLRNRLMDASEDLSANVRLALCIKAFNMRETGAVVAKKQILGLLDNDPFPRIDPPTRARLRVAAE